MKKGQPNRGPQPVRSQAQPKAQPAPVRVPGPVEPIAPAAQSLPTVDATAEATEEEAKPEGYTPQEAAQVLGGEKAGFTGKSIRRHIRSGHCPATKASGRWYVTEDQLTEYLDKLEQLKAAKAAKEAEEAAKAAQEVAAVTQIELPVTEAPRV